jgi:hypothetical protein
MEESLLLWRKARKNEVRLVPLSSPFLRKRRESIATENVDMLFFMKNGSCDFGGKFCYNWCKIRD